jgi:hypothetical protein
MSWTKRDFVIQAFEEIGFASYVYDAQPEQLQSVLRRLDSMLATWNAKGIRIGYPLPSGVGESDLDEVTGVPDAATEAIYTNLAIRIAPSFGKTIQQETKQAADIAYNALLAGAAFPPEMNLAGVIPGGAGNKSQYPFIRETEQPLLSGQDGEIDFN